VQGSVLAMRMTRYGAADMSALASNFARQALVVVRQASLLAMPVLVVTPVVYVRMHWLALEVHLQQVWYLP